MPQNGECITIPISKTLSFPMIFIEKGNFTMGEKKNTIDIQLARDFYLDQYPVTQEIWRTVMQNTDIAEPSYFKGNKRPVEQVSWEDCQQFLNRLNTIFAERNAAEGLQFYLPSEAQWEYAARGGRQGVKDNFRYAGSNKLKEVGWYRLNSHRETKSVGLKFSNQLDIYDLSGNVREWCQDAYTSLEKLPKDGSPYVSKEEKRARRVVRSGSWDYVDDLCRVACRSGRNLDDRYINFGLRLARY